MVILGRRKIRSVSELFHVYLFLQYSQLVMVHLIFHMLGSVVLKMDAVLLTFVLISSGVGLFQTIFTIALIQSIRCNFLHRRNNRKLCIVYTYKIFFLNWERRNCFQKRLCIQVMEISHFYHRSGGQVSFSLIVIWHYCDITDCNDITLDTQQAVVFF